VGGGNGDGSFYFTVSTRLECATLTLATSCWHSFQGCVCVSSGPRDMGYIWAGTWDINRQNKTKRLRSQRRRPKLKPKAFRQICLFGQSRKPWNICTLSPVCGWEGQFLTSVDCLVRKNFRCSHGKRLTFLECALIATIRFSKNSGYFLKPRIKMYLWMYISIFYNTKILWKL